MDLDQLYSLIEELVLYHSPSGVETEIDHPLLQKFSQLGVETWQDSAGNIIAKIKGKDSSHKIAITAHKDEIGAMVKSITKNGRIYLKNLGGSFPWVYGEGVVDILGDHQTIQGILSFGSRHISHESPQYGLQVDRPLKWENVWVETKCTEIQLLEAGVRVGSRVVVGKHRKKPLRINNYIASYTLDNKASLAILLKLAEEVKTPIYDVYLVASAKEEVGALGALYFTQNTRLSALIALEICPISAEYPVQQGDCPVLLAQDGYGIYDDGLNQEIYQSAVNIGIPLQWTTLNSFGSDASIAMKFGHVSRASCLAFPTENTHGYEIAHLEAIQGCIEVLKEYLRT